MPQKWILNLISFFNCFLHAGTIPSNHKLDEIDEITWLISDVIQNIARSESAQCMILVNEGGKSSQHKRSQLQLNEALALTMFEDSESIGDSLAQSGKLCPFYVMHFQRSEVALQFLNKNRGHLR